jgi:hypothetical protein
VEYQAFRIANLMVGGTLVEAFEHAARAAWYHCSANVAVAR